MKIGYIRVSKQEQNEALQRDGLSETKSEFVLKLDTSVSSGKSKILHRYDKGYFRFYRK